MSYSLLAMISSGNEVVLGCPLEDIVISANLVGACAEVALTGLEFGKHKPMCLPHLAINVDFLHPSVNAPMVDGLGDLL